jgi:uncharacterized protein YqgC (DUF456 family)
MMSTGGQWLIALAMAIGLAGVLVPVLPGLLLVWGAGLAWTILDGGGPARWTVFAMLTALFAGATVAKYVLPARKAAARGAPLSTLLVGAVFAVVGFFVIPVVGAPIGGAAGIYLAEYARLRDPRAALRATRAALIAIGIGVLIEFGAGVVMVLTWVGGVLVT